MKIIENPRVYKSDFYTNTQHFHLKCVKCLVNALENDKSKLTSAHFFPLD